MKTNERKLLRSGIEEVDVAFLRSLESINSQAISLQADMEIVRGVPNVNRLLLANGENGPLMRIMAANKIQDEVFGIMVEEVDSNGALGEVGFDEFVELMSSGHVDQETVLLMISAMDLLMFEVDKIVSKKHLSKDAYLLSCAHLGLRLACRVHEGIDRFDLNYQSMIRTYILHYSCLEIGLAGVRTGAMLSIANSNTWRIPKNAYLPQIHALISASSKEELKTIQASALFSGLGTSGIDEDDGGASMTTGPILS